MKGNSVNYFNNANDWIINTKFKIIFDVSRIQNLNDIKGLITFTEHFLIIKINEDKKKSKFFEVIKNMLNPIYCDEDNQIFLNYCLIKSFITQNGQLDIIFTNPVNKRNYNLIIKNIEKNQLLFASSIKIEELNKIAKSVNAKIISEIKNVIEEFLLMITAFKDIIEKALIKDGLLDDKIMRALNEAKKYYEKNIKELKKQNQFKNDINKKILKEKIQAKQADKNSISMLSHLEPHNYSTFEMILADLRNRGLKLIEENINLFFEITSLENSALNLKKVDKSKVTDNLKTINSKNIITHGNRIDDNQCSTNYYSTKYVNNNKNIEMKLEEERYYQSFNNTKAKIIENCNINDMLSKNKSFDDSTRFSKKRNQIFQNNLVKKTELSVNRQPPMTPNMQNKKTFFTNKLHDNRSNQINNSNHNKECNFNNKETSNQSINNNYKTNFDANKKFRIDSDTITDVNGLFEDIISQKNSDIINMNNDTQINYNPNSNYDSNNRPTTPNKEFYLPRNKLEENRAFENYYFENDLDSININYNQEESENISSSTKTNSKKDVQLSNNIDGVDYINNLKELKESSNSQNPCETPKFCNKNITRKKSKTGLKEIENINFDQLTTKINRIKNNHLFLVNNNWNNIFANASQLFSRKYFEFCFEEFFPKFFVIEKDFNGILKTDSFYSFLFYLRGLKNHLFTDENKIQFSNVFFFD